MAELRQEQLGAAGPLRRPYVLAWLLLALAAVALALVVREPVRLLTGEPPAFFSGSGTDVGTYPA